MSSICPNCGSSIGCGCQRRTSISGKACCKKCVTAENLKSQPSIKVSPTITHTVLPPK